MALQLILAAMLTASMLVAFAPAAGAADCFAPDPTTGELRRVECPPQTTAPPVTAPPATSPPVVAPPVAPVTTRAPAVTSPPATTPPPETTPAPVVTSPPTASTLAVPPVANVASTTTSTVLTNTVEAASRTASEGGGVNTFVIAGVIAALATLVLVGIVVIDGTRRRFQPPMET